MQHSWKRANHYDKQETGADTLLCNDERILSMKFNVDNKMFYVSNVYDPFTDDDIFSASWKKGVVFYLKIMARWLYWYSSV